MCVNATESAMFDRTSLLNDAATLSDETLSDDQLDEVAGGLYLTKVTDASSPNLFIGGGAGKHFPN
jgi:hypothetical protein